MLKAGIGGSRFERQHSEYAFMDAAERFLADETLERLDAQREFAGCQRTLAAEATRAKTAEIFRQRVIGVVDNPEILAPASAW